MALPRYRANNTPKPSGSANSTSVTPSPAPTTNTSPSNGGGSSGKTQNWIMPIGIAYLVIRGLFIIGRNYITIFDWIIIIILAFFAILSFWKGKNRWLSLVLIVAIGCIIWFNQAHIDSFKQQSTSPTEQSAGKQEQVAPAPTEEIPSTERVVISGKKITLTGDGTYSVPMGRKSLCLTNLGMKDGSQYVVQDVTVAGVEYIFSGTECKSLPDELKGDVIIDFFPGKDHGTPKGFKELYNYWKSQPGGQAEWPVIRIGE